MKKYLVILLTIILISCSSTNGTINLGYGDYSENNPLLSIGANSTIRISETTLDVLSPSQAVYKVKKALTIYDKEDKGLATVALYYGAFKSIDYLKANIIDKNGRVVQSYSLKDAQDYSTAWGSTFFSSERLKVLEMPYNNFPYTVEIEHQQTYNGLLNLPSWRPQRLEQSVESATFTLIDRQNSGVRYFNKNIDKEPVKSTEAGVNRYTWSLDFLMAKEREPFGSPSSEILPHVLVAPGRFNMEKSQGDASTWKSFGKWYYELGKETRELPQEAKTEIDGIVSRLDSEEQVVEALFNYLQERSRYVSIQLGIGGWKPFPAEYVFENSYGDCKALTNYMQAALEYVGIQAEGVLIHRGVNGPRMIIEFPSNQFNHIILRVTLKNGEVIWLECTDKYLPPNHIGPDNEGKNALLITEDGGEVIKTPSYEYSQNKSERIMSFVINETGNTNVKSTVKSEGISQDYLLYNILPVSEKERVDWLQDQLEVDNSKIIEYDFSKVGDDDEYASYDFTAQLGNYVQTSSKRLYIPLNKMNRWKFVFPENDDRDQSINLGYGFQESDSITFEIPQNFEIEAAPKNTEYNYSFGEFKASFEVKGENELLYKRHFALKEKTIGSENYEQVKEFFDKVRYADLQNVVLVKKD